MGYTSVSRTELAVPLDNIPDILASGEEKARASKNLQSLFEPAKCKLRQSRRERRVSETF
jgi:hypothetical protein